MRTATSVIVSAVVLSGALIAAAGRQVPQSGAGEVIPGGGWFNWSQYVAEARVNVPLPPGMQPGLLRCQYVSNGSPSQTRYFWYTDTAWLESLGPGHPIRELKIGRQAVECPPTLAEAERFFVPASSLDPLIAMPGAPAVIGCGGVARMLSVDTRKVLLNRWLRHVATPRSPGGGRADVPARSSEISDTQVYQLLTNSELIVVSATSLVVIPATIDKDAFCALDPLDAGARRCYTLARTDREASLALVERSTRCRFEMGPRVAFVDGAPPRVPSAKEIAVARSERVELARIIADYLGREVLASAFTEKAALRFFAELLRTAGKPHIDAAREHLGADNVDRLVRSTLMVFYPEWSAAQLEIGARSIRLALDGKVTTAMLARVETKAVLVNDLMERYPDRQFALSVVRLLSEFVAQRAP
jgi:hypothetical protein